MRFWSMCQTLVAYPEGIRRSFLLREIFQGQSKELKYYESIHILSIFPQTADGVQELEITPEVVMKMHQNQSIESILSGKKIFFLFFFIEIF